MNPDMQVSLYTYGSPRVFMGNTKEANNMNSAFHGEAHNQIV